MCRNRCECSKKEERRQVKADLVLTVFTPHTKNEQPGFKRRMVERRDCTTAELAHETGISATTFGRVVSKELKMVKKMCVWAPDLLTEAQVQNRTDACRNNLLRHRRHLRLLKRTLAIDETWVGLYTEPESHKHRVWIDADEEPPELVHKESRGSKWMLITAMDFWGVAFWRLCPEKMAVTSEVYCQFLDDNTENWMAAHNFKRAIIAHDNAKPHPSRIVQRFFEEKNIEAQTQPPYSPELQPCHFNWFGQMKIRCSGKCSDNWSFAEMDINSISSAHVKGTKLLGVQMLHGRWERVVNNGRAYPTEHQNISFLSCLL
nr:transposase [Haemonchus contortus]